MKPQFPAWVRQLLDTDSEVVYVLDAKLSIAACNRAWDNFAAANGGVGISAADVVGQPVFDFIPPVLVAFYQQKYDAARRTGVWVGFDYDCSSPATYRQFHMALQTLENGAIVVVNSLRPHRISPFARDKAAEPASVYFSSDGVITMCAHCRRTQHPQFSEVWEWVPQFVSHPGDKVSHGLCPRCLAQHYPEYRDI